MSEYKEFIKKHFPHSGMINDRHLELIYSRICENNLVTDIYEKYIRNEEHNSSISCHLLFLQRYKNQFNKILLYIPLNDISSVNFCMRVTIENLLKFLYSVYFNKELQDINILSFRHIKEDLNSLETELFINKDKINILTNFYGVFSNLVHEKINKNQSQLRYLENIIEEGELNLGELDDRLLKTLNAYEELLFNIFKISEKTLSASEILRLKNTLSTKRLEKVRQHFYIE